MCYSGPHEGPRGKQAPRTQQDSHHHHHHRPPRAHPHRPPLRHLQDLQEAPAAQEVQGRICRVQADHTGVGCRVGKGGRWGQRVLWCWKKGRVQGMNGGVLLRVGRAKTSRAGGGGKGRFGMGPREDCICEWGFQWE